MRKLNQLQLAVLRSAAKRPGGRVYAHYNTVMFLLRRNMIDRHDVITAAGRRAVAHRGARR